MTPCLALLPLREKVARAAGRMRGFATGAAAATGRARADGSERPLIRRSPTDTFSRKGRRAAPLAAVLLFAAPAAAQEKPDPLGPGLAAGAAFLVEPVAETIVEALPAGPLYWRVEAYPTLTAARAAAGPLSLAAEAWGRPWLVTLGPKGAASAGGQKLAEVGPVPIPEARRLRLRLNRAGGPPGVSTPVHTHPGSEAFYVLKGQLTQRMGHGRTTLDAGQAMNGHAPGMAMQLTSTGAGELEQLVMFVVDADRPFSEPARWE